MEIDPVSVRKYTMTGLIMLLPLTLTIWIITSLVGWLTGPYVGFAEGILKQLGIGEVSFLFLSSHDILVFLSQVLVILFILTFILFVGTVGGHFLGRSLLRLSDKVLHNIPIISSVYKTSQELIETILATDNRAFKQVVLVPFPNADCLTIGLVTREGPVAPNLIPVFVPTTPNPTSGYLLVFDRSVVIPLDMSIEEAFRYIISCGALLTNKTFIPKAQAGGSSLQD